MKYSKKRTIFCAGVLFFLLTISSISVLSCNERPISKKKKNHPSNDNNNLAVEEIIKKLEIIKKRVYQSSWYDWKFPAGIRKLVMIMKLNAVENQLMKGDYKGAIEKFNNDIEPKLTNTWIKNNNLQEELTTLCNTVLLKMQALLNPDTPPTILLTPNMTLTEEEFGDGFLIEWQVTDESGLSNVIVKLNGTVIASYSNLDTVEDSYFLTSMPYTIFIEITATDNNGLVSTKTSIFRFIDDDRSPPIVSMEYDGDYTNLNPGNCLFTFEDQESGIGEVLILVDNEISVQETLTGQTTISYIVSVPREIGIHTFEVTAKNNDNDWNGDQDGIYRMFLIEISPSLPTEIGL